MSDNENKVHPEYGATCEYCDQMMLHPDTTTCSVRTVEYRDETLDAIPYENESIAVEDRDTHRCHDCGVKLGQYHHRGCDMERCPNCTGQAIFCPCNKIGNYFIPFEDISNLLG